jgi:NAD(P)-dependent dehydrogenase (short-subunit alcohol dehydrogenase family)
MSVWFITGASRGFGLDITKEALSRGDSVVATARNPQSVLDAIPDGGDRLLSVGLDVSVPEQVSAAVDAAAERLGRIDVLVNNAGRGLVGALEETSDAEAHARSSTSTCSACWRLPERSCLICGRPDPGWW